MRFISTFIVLTLILGSCSTKAKKDTFKLSNDDAIGDIQIPMVINDKSKLLYNRKTSLWTMGGERFSGYAASYYPDSTLKQKIGIFEGRNQNESIDWYYNGLVKQSSNYHKGKLHGEKKSWSSDTKHLLISHLNYRLGKPHGIQKKWYASGEIFKILQLNMGEEEGIQQAFRKNGDLFANYEAREGRIFGLKKASLCYGLDNEKVQYEN